MPIWLIVGSAVGAAVLAGAGRAAALTPSVTEFTGGATPGFSANSAPKWITAGPDGNLWFTEETDPGRIGRIAPAGAVTEFTGGVTPNFTANSQPGSITPGPDGNLWFTETNPGRIARITPSGSVTESSAGVGQLMDLNAITAGPDGNLWYLQEQGAKVGRFPPGGTAAEFATDTEPSGITTGPDGKLWFTEEADPGHIATVTTAGAVTSVATGGTGGFSLNSLPDGIAAGPDGNLWFTEQADPGRIARITTTGVVTEVATGGSGGLSLNSEPTTIALGPDGNLWFTEQANPGRIGRITPLGSVTEFTAGATPGFSANSAPESITAGPDGNLWFVAAENPGRVGRLNIVPPLALTGGVSGLTTTSATIAGTANGRGLSTTVQFDFGRPGAATTATTSRSIGSGVTNTPVSAKLIGLAPNTTYRYRTAATNPTDTAAGAFQTFTTLARASISRLLVAPDTFRAAGRGGSVRRGSVARKRKPPIGTRVSYRDSQAATTTFTALRRVRGVKRGKKCVKPPKGKSKRKRCTRWVRVGSFKHVDRAGRNSFRFTGRVRGHKLKPGRYRLQAVPRFAGSNGKAVKTSFRVVR